MINFNFEKIGDMLINIALFIVVCDFLIGVYQGFLNK